MRNKLLFFTLCFSFFYGGKKLNAQTINHNDSLVLMQLYNNCNGAGWINKTNWGGGNYPWQGVSTDSSGNVTQIDLDSNNLSGVLPDISGLTYLQYFDCSQNSLSGNIPSLAGLENLRYFDARLNQFTGNIPSLSGLNNLQSFYCSANQLNGNIPDLSGLAYLQNFDCSVNLLNGAIPSFAGLNNLQYFDCSYNQLSGNIPALNDAQNLRYFDCSNNQLTGSIPSLSESGGLEYFSSFSNQINGITPFSTPANLYRFNIASNEINYTPFENLADAETISKLKEDSFYTYTPQAVSIQLNDEAGIINTDRNEGGNISNLTYEWYEAGNNIPFATVSGNNAISDLSQYHLSAGDKIYVRISHKDWTILSYTDIKNLSLSSDSITLNNALPISLLKFYTTSQNNVIQLFWQTALEEDCKGFAIQHSSDGKVFTNLAFVNAKGNNSAYTYIDVKPFDNENYYRLLITNLDGSYNLSNIVKAYINISDDIHLYPNPARQLIYIKNDKEEDAQIFNIMGASVKNIHLKNGTGVFDISALSPGIYVLKTISHPELKFIKQ